LAVKEVVLDSSAAVALAKDEAGARSLVPHYLAGAIMSAVNLAEFVQVLRRFDLNPEPYLQIFRDAGMRIVPADAELAIAAGELERLTRHIGLSLGDRFCLALAVGTGRAVVTTGRVWQTIDLGVEVILARGGD
jgi:PIN domain nuclease of toxin-antitoxin system